AYRWLTENAERFSFGLNRPRNSGSRPPREPWHWRFVGSTETDRAESSDSDLD
ncbi:MAG: D-alanyl-D-alanine carboxypeptidase family protein, partial [Candidatus Acidiferrales bacterium]